MNEQEKVVWILDETTLSFTVDDKSETNSYTIDYTQNPISLETTILGKKVRCIMEFLDENTFRITGEDDEEAPRLRSFDGAEDIITFRRK